MKKTYNIILIDQDTFSHIYFTNMLFLLPVCQCLLVTAYLPVLLRQCPYTHKKMGFVTI